MQKWTIQYVDTLRKDLKKLGYSEKERFKTIVLDLEKSDNPKRLGELKGTRRHGFCYVTEVTKSYRLAYKVYDQQHVIILLTIGDHKKVYGRDKRS